MRNSERGLHHSHQQEDEWRFLPRTLFRVLFVDWPPAADHYFFAEELLYYMDSALRKGSDYTQVLAKPGLTSITGLSTSGDKDEPTSRCFLSEVLMRHC